MAFISFDNSLGFGALVSSTTGALLPPAQIVSDGPGSFVSSGNAFTLSSSFNQGAIKFTMTGSALSATFVRLDSITYTNATGTPTVIVGSMNLYWDVGLETAAQALARVLSGDDSIFGNSYADYIEAGTGNDRVIGNDGNDTLLGEDGNDVLNGSDGIDSITGGRGSDTVQGGTGQDLLTGNAGRDVFRFVRIDDSRLDLADTIADFTRGEDRIDLALTDAFAATRSDDAYLFRGTARFSSATQGELRYETNTRTNETLVYLDTDADRSPEAVIRLSGIHSLTAADFIL